MLDGWLLHLIFSHLPPHDLITCAAVCREFYSIARADRAWERHKQRVLEYCPLLAPVFEAHGQETDGKRVLKKRQKQTIQGQWYVFARFLMRNPFELAYERRKSKFAQGVTSAVVEAAVLCLYYPKKRERYNPYNKHCVDYKQKIWFIHICVHSDVSIVVLSEWMSRYAKVSRSFPRHTEAKIPLDVLAQPFLSVVHDELEHFEKFAKAIFKAVE